MARGRVSKSPSALRTREAAFLHRLQVRTARVERDVQAGARHAGADVSSDGAGAGDQEPHRLSLGERLGDVAALDFAGRGAGNRRR